MTQRFINPVPQFFADDGDPVPGGKLYFYESGTTTLADTYADINGLIPNANPVLIDGAGRTPNIFLNGSYKVKYVDADDVQLWERDPVSGTIAGQFQDWNAGTTFSASDIVRGSDLLYYISLIDNNTGNNPVTSPTAWSPLNLIETWNTHQTYGEDAVVIASNGLFYRSRVTGNIGHDPLTDLGIYWSIIGTPVVSGTSDSFKSLQVNSTGAKYELVGPLTAFKNKIINGDFDIWQRGITASTIGEFNVADRWAIDVQGANVVQIDQIAFAPGQETVPNNPSYYLQYIRSTTGGSQDYILQRIEGVKTFSGNKVAVSFWAKGTATKQVRVLLSQDFGVGGDPSVDEEIATITLTAGWAKYAAITTLNSILGATIGTGNFLSLIFRIDGPEGNMTFQIAQVQVEAGSIATAFEQRPISTELALCQRYYEHSYETGVYAGAVGSGLGERLGYARALAAQYLHIDFKVPKRRTPTITVYSPVTGNNTKVANLTTAADITLNAIHGLNENNVPGIGVTPVPSADDVLSFHWVVNAEL